MSSQLPNNGKCAHISTVIPLDRELSRELIGSTSTNQQKPYDFYKEAIPIVALVSSPQHVVCCCVF